MVRAQTYDYLSSLRWLNYFLYLGWPFSPAEQEQLWCPLCSFGDGCWKALATNLPLPAWCFTFLEASFLSSCWTNRAWIQGIQGTNHEALLWFPVGMETVPADLFLFHLVAQEVFVSNHKTPPLSFSPQKGQVLPPFTRRISWLAERSLILLQINTSLCLSTWCLL